MALKAVLFDMDGVIINSEPEYFKVEMELFKKLDINFTEDNQKKYVGINPLVMWKEIKEEYNLIQTANELYDAEAKMIQEYYANGELNAIMPTLDLILDVYNHGYLCAVASSSEKQNIYHVLNRLGLKVYFKAVVSNNDVERCKPMPDIYLLAAQMLNVKPSECIVIEDSRAGVTAAKAANMKVVRYSKFQENTKDKEQADCLVRDMREITLSRLVDLAQ